MSECNYCGFLADKGRAADKGQVASLAPEDGWQRVYVHPPDVNISRLSAHQRTRYRTGTSYMIVPDHCVC